MPTIASLSKVLNITTNKGVYELIEGHVYTCTYRGNLGNIETITGTLAEIQQVPVARVFPGKTDSNFTLRFDCSTAFKSNIIDVRSFDVDSIKYSFSESDIEKLASFLDTNMSSFVIKRVTDENDFVTAYPYLLTNEEDMVTLHIPTEVIDIGLLL